MLAVQELTKPPLVLHTGASSFPPLPFCDPPSEHYLLWGDPALRQPAAAYVLFGGEIATRETLAANHRSWLVVMLDRSPASLVDQTGWFDEPFLPVQYTEIDRIAMRLYDPGGCDSYRHLDIHTALAVRGASRLSFPIGAPTIREPAPPSGEIGGRL